MSIRLCTMALALAALAATGCGTRVGKEGSGSSNPNLSAVITPIGHKATSAAGANPVAITVRSGGDVILSGKDSDGGAVAIKSFAWAQSGGTALPALPDPGAMLYRTANTISFRAPYVAASTTLSFKLTITDALNATASADVNVTVEPAGDPDQFLTLPTFPHQFKVAVATVEGLTSLAADAPVCISVVRQISYTSRDGTQRLVTLPQDASLQADTTWSAASGGAPAGQAGALSAPSVAAAVSSYTNPRVTFTVPTFNDDALFAMFNQPVAGESSSAQNARIAQQLVPADLDTAKQLLQITAAPGTCAAPGAGELAGSTLVVALLDSAGNVANVAAASAKGVAVTMATDKSGATLTSDTLQASLGTGQIETAQSAQAYYKTLDPTDSRTTLDDWLDANCFDHTATDYGVAAAGSNAAHAVYTNNFDLGFGRDMYFIKCAAPHKDSTGRITANTGDMASVVINYISLEQAALRQNPIIAVAMEYGPAADGSNPTQRFTKFYVFAPDDRTGQLKRVGSANFDHRGQKYVPGACTLCHGGTVPVLPANFTSAMAYPVIQDPTKDATQAATSCAQTASACLAAGNTDSAFLPWDLDSFLYSDTDPAFTGIAIPGTDYTRARQEPFLKALNGLVYQTFQPEVEKVSVPNGDGTSSDHMIDRYAAARLLVEKWYGGTGLPNATYDDSSVPAGWAAPTGADTLYHNSFSRHCRACHTVNPEILIQFTGLNGYHDDGYPAFVAEFANGANGAAGLGKSYVFQQGIMPAARLTMDRFWVNYDGGDSGAKVLATQLTNSEGATGLLTSTKDATPTGTALLTVLVNGNPPNATTGKFAASRFTGTRVDGSASFFVAKWTWTLCVIASSGGACTPKPVIAGTTASPGIDTSAFGNYQLSVTADNGLGQTVSKTFEIDVPDLLPTPSSVANCPANQSAPFSSSGAGASQTIDVSGCFTVHGDAPYSLKVGQVAGTYTAGPITGASLPWNASIVAGTAVIDPVTGRNTTVPHIQFNFNPSATTSNNTIYYQLCDTDSECATGSDQIALAESLVPSSATLTAYWDPQLNPNYSSGAVTTVPGGLAISGSPPAASLSTLQNSLVLNIASTDDVTLDLSNLTAGSLSSLHLPGTSPANLLSQVANLSYQPPAGCLTADINGSASVTGCGNGVSALTFKDQLSSTKVNPTPAAGTVKVNIQALASFSQTSNATPSQPSVFAVLNTAPTAAGNDGKTCGSASCHASGSGNVWDYSANASTTYTNVINAGLVTPGDPSSSLFYTTPCINGVPPTMHKEFDETSQQCQVIYQWILEGGANN